MKGYWPVLSRVIYFFCFIILVLGFESTVLAAMGDGYDYPVGKPDGDNYRNGSLMGGGDGWGFLEFNGAVLHPGEDWNRGSGSDDYGDPLYSIATGTIVGASNYGGNWGKVILIRHNVSGIDVWSQYAHLSTINVKIGETVTRGQFIGEIGDADGRWASHLHFEIRKQGVSASFWPKTGWQESRIRECWLDPSEFIKANRPLPPPIPQKLSINSTGVNGAEVGWDVATGKEFDRYDLYRSEATGENGKKIFTTADQNILTYTDPNLYSEQDYYYRLFTYYKNGQVAESNEVTIRFNRESINISNAPGVQRYVGISKNKVYWENNYRDQTSFPTRKNLYYYDLETKTTSSMPIGSATDRIEGPYKPSIGGDWLCYYGKRSTYGNYDIYCRNLASDMPVDIQITSYGGDDVDPQVSEEGILTWQGVIGTEKRIFWTNLNSGVQIYSVLESGYQVQPRIWGNNIIWKQQTVAGQQRDLRYKNIETGAEGILINDVGDGAIDVWNDYVIYVKDDKLQLLKISNPSDEEVIVEKGLNARMRDGKIVYTKAGSDSKYYVYVYILATGKTINVAGPLKYQPSPVIYENMIAYDASPTDTTTDMDIYLTNL